MQEVSGDPLARIEGRCGACGAEPIDPWITCQEMWDHLLARSFGELAFASRQRLIVDLYALQHPDAYCASARSYAAHLTGLCVVVEHGGDPRINRRVQRWLSRSPAGLVKGPVPERRGETTLTHVLEAGGPQSVATRTGEWARDVWEAYAVAQELAREWIREAMSNTGAGGHRR